MTYRELLRNETFLELDAKLREIVLDRGSITYTENLGADSKLFYQVIPSTYTVREDHISISFCNIGMIIIGCVNTEWEIEKEITPDGESYSLTRNDGTIFRFDF